MLCDSFAILFYFVTWQIFAESFSPGSISFLVPLKTINRATWHSALIDTLTWSFWCYHVFEFHSFRFISEWFPWLVFSFTSIKLILSNKNVGVTFSQLVTDLNWPCQLPSLQAFRWLTSFKNEVKRLHTWEWRQTQQKDEYTKRRIHRRRAWRKGSAMMK